MKGFLKDDGGQAIVEYILGIVIALGVVSVLAIGFRKSIMKLWLTISKNVSAACPGCPADPSLHFGR